MVRNLAFILYVLSHVSAFFFIMVNFLKKKKKKKKKNRQRDVHGCAACSRQTERSLTGRTAGELLLKLVLL